MVAGTPTLLSLSGPSDHMAEEKAASLSPSVDKRWRLMGPKQIQAGLLKKASLLDSGAAAGKGGQDLAHSELILSTALDKAGLDRPLRYKACTEQRQGSFTELSGLQESPGDMQALKRKPEDPEGQLGTPQLPLDLPGASTDRTECSVWPGAAQSGKRSAFRRPASRRVEKPRCSPRFWTVETQRALGSSRDSSPLWISHVGLSCQLSSSWEISGDCTCCPRTFYSAMLSTGLPHHGWITPRCKLPHPRHLPPQPAGFSCHPHSSPGLPTQNWCAKCNLAFRLTADLVLHMRSHHKREHGGPDPHSKKRREEVLTCPICHEYFRERHHLSRHMTSHS